MRITVAVAAAAALAAACSRPVSLPERQLQVPVPESWSGAVADRAQPASDWWAYFGDPGLDAAVRSALDCSRTLRSALARIEAAVEERRIAGATAWPEVGVGINRLRQRQNFVGLPFPGLKDRVLSNTFGTAGLTLNLSWEADLWQRVAARKVEADAGVAARAADLAAARLSLSGQVAKAWFAAVEAQGQVALAEATVEHLETVSERTRERYRFGSRSPVDVRVADGNVARARSSLKERERQRDLFVRQVEVLACEYPAGKLAPSPALVDLPDRVPAGLPSDLVRRRPDMVAAEQGLLAADARTVQSKAALRPGFSLTSSLGTSSNTLLDLVNPGLRVWSLALGLAEPVFSRGRLRAGVRSARALARSAAADYESRIWTAYLEVESALASEAALREQRSALADSRRITDEAAALAESRYAAGMGDVFAVLGLRQTALETRSAILALRRAQVDNRVELHLALGGGFEAGVGASCCPAPAPRDQ